jgi:TetR/AcrR family fatty acid metabolism transcriptional regulator
MLQEVDKTQSTLTGYTKIIEAFKSLIDEKEFTAITWEDIANRAEVNQGLIYRHFGNTRRILHYIFGEYVDHYTKEERLAVSGIQGTINKIRKHIWFRVHTIDQDRCFAKLLLIEIRRNYVSLKIETDQVVKNYDRLLTTLIQEGIKNKEIRDDITPYKINRMIRGAIEHLCLPSVFYHKEIYPDVLTEIICNIIFPGIEKKNTRNRYNLGKKYNGRT